MQWRRNTNNGAKRSSTHIRDQIVAPNGETHTLTNLSLPKSIRYESRQPTKSTGSHTNIIYTLSQVAPPEDSNININSNTIYITMIWESY